jgi:hypothetical protein
MVSLELQNSYLSKAIQNDRLRAYYSLLQLEVFDYSSEGLGDIDKVYYGIINSIVKRNKEEFQDYYDKMSKRTPNENSPFIYHDLLIFSIVVGVFIFESDKSWLKKAIAKRKESSIRTTFDNILNENYQSKSNISEVISVFLHLTEEEKPTDEILESTYTSILNNKELFKNKNDFQALTAIKAFELILGSIREFPNRKDYVFLKSFETRFDKRIRLFSSLIYSMVLLIGVYYLFQLVSFNQKVKEFLDNLNAVIGVLGYLAINGGLFAAFKNNFELAIKRLFGYRKGPD